MYPPSSHSPPVPTNSALLGEAYESKDWWKTKYRGIAEHMDSLKFFNPFLMSLSTPQRMCTSAGSLFEVNKAEVTANMLSGCYRLIFWWATGHLPTQLGFVDSLVAMERFIPPTYSLRMFFSIRLHLTVVPSLFPTLAFPVVENYTNWLKSWTSNFCLTHQFCPSAHLLFQRIFHGLGQVNYLLPAPSGSWV